MATHDPHQGAPKWTTLSLALGAEELWVFISGLAQPRLLRSSTSNRVLITDVPFSVPFQGPSPTFLTRRFQTFREESARQRRIAPCGGPRSSKTEEREPQPCVISACSWPWAWSRWRHGRCPNRVPPSGTACRPTTLNTLPDPMRALIPAPFESTEPDLRARSSLTAKMMPIPGPCSAC